MSSTVITTSPKPSTNQALDTLSSQLGPVRQLGYVVDDIERTLNGYRKLGVGGWTVMKNVTLNGIFHGQPSNPVIHVALGYCGDMQIELIQQVDNAPSPYRGFIERGHFGLHHTAFLVNDIEREAAQLVQDGFELIFDIQMPKGMGRYKYLQSAELGPHHFIELLENTTMMQQMFAAGSAAAQTWPQSRIATLNVGFYLKIFRFLKGRFTKR